VIDVILFWLGCLLVVLGGILDVVAAVGINKFNNFFLRLHAATVGTIGGSVYPLIGIALISLSLDTPPTFKFYVAGVSLVSAAIIALISPAGTHILARAAYKSGEVRPEPIVVDKLAEVDKK